MKVPEVFEYKDSRETYNYDIQTTSWTVTKETKTETVSMNVDDVSKKLQIPYESEVSLPEKDVI